MDKLVRVIIVGPGGVGKTTLVNSIMGISKSVAATKSLTMYLIGIDSTSVILIDTPGQRELIRLVEYGIRSNKVHVAVGVVDVSDVSTYAGLEDYFKLVNKYRPHSGKAVVINKVDVRTPGSWDVRIAERICSEYGGELCLGVFQISALKSPREESVKLLEDIVGRALERKLFELKI